MESPWRRHGAAKQRPHRQRAELDGVPSRPPATGHTRAPATPLIS